MRPPHPTLSRKAGEGEKERELIEVDRIPSPIPMGEGQGEGNFIAVGERKSIEQFVVNLNSSQKRGNYHVPVAADPSDYR